MGNVVLYINARVFSFTDVLKPYYANCDAVVIVYDISNEPSFLEAQRWVIEIRQMVS